MKQDMVGWLKTLGDWWENMFPISIVFFWKLVRLDPQPP